MNPEIPNTPDSLPAAARASPAAPTPAPPPAREEAPVSPPESQLTEQKLRAYAEGRVSRRRALRVHLTCYALVNAFLVALNLVVTPDYFWAFFPLTGWALGVVFHAVAFWTYPNLKGAGHRLVLFHVAAYGAVNAYLFALNWFLPGTTWWAAWPWGVWTVFLVVHLVARKGRRGAGDASRMDRAVDKEMHKIMTKYVAATRPENEA